MPERVQLSQAAGWRKPPNTIVVTRATRFGNPFKILPPVRGLSRSWRVIWVARGAGFGKLPPAHFDAIVCETEHQAHEQAVRLFPGWIMAPQQADLLGQVRRELAGCNLACSCPLDLPCHADVLLELANQP
jgi:hypothetical protein